MVHGVELRGAGRHRAVALAHQEKTDVTADPDCTVVLAHFFFGGLQRKKAIYVFKV